MADFRSGGMLGHAIFADGLVAAALALGRTREVPRDLIDALPALRKAQGQHILRLAGEGIAGTHMPLPIH